jgi:streptogramin lyase
MASKVDPRVLWKTPGKQPNGLQATTDGLWVIDQVDPNRIHLLSYEGEVLRDLGETRARHSSGITVAPDGNLWVASTFTYEMIKFDSTTGQELAAFPTPPYDQSGGAHGTEWRWGQLWFNVPKAGRIYVADPDTGKIVRDIPAHGDRAHGIAWDEDGSLWSVDTNKRVIFKLDPTTGAILDAIGVAGPEPHGMTIWKGQFWLCDAATREVFVIDVPRR